MFRIGTRIKAADEHEWLLRAWPHLPWAINGAEAAQVCKRRRVVGKAQAQLVGESLRSSAPSEEPRSAARASEVGDSPGLSYVCLGGWPTPMPPGAVRALSDDPALAVLADGLWKGTGARSASQTGYNRWHKRAARACPD